MYALNTLCRRRLGIDIDSISRAEFASILPDIVEAVASEYVAVHRQVLETKKAVDIRGAQHASFIPNGMTIRDEHLSPDVPDSDSSDPNAVLESVLPL